MNTEVNITIQKLLLNLEVDMPVKTTISDVIMWIYKKHGIWIEVSLTDNTRDYYFDYTIITSNNRDFNL